MNVRYVRLWFCIQIIVLHRIAFGLYGPRLSHVRSHT